MTQMPNILLDAASNSKKISRKKMSEDKEKKTGIRPVSRQQDFGMLHVIVFKCLE